LVEALAARLPAGCALEDAVAALREASDALPQEKINTKQLLKRHESRRAREILRKVRERTVKAPEAQDDDEEEEEFLETAAEAASTSVFSDEATDNAELCVKECETLLRSALASLQPVERASEVLEGLLALQPVSGLTAESEGDWTLEVATKFAALVPLVSAALNSAGDLDTLPIWSRFLSLALLAPLRVALAEGEREEEVIDLARRMGGLVSLVASTTSARGALRLVFSACAGTDVPSGPLLQRLGAALLPVLSAALGEGAEAPQYRSEAAAMMHLLRLVALLRSSRSSAGEAVTKGLFIADPQERALSLAADGLKAALARADLRPLLEEADEVASEIPGKRGRLLTKRLKAASSREAAASAFCEALELRAADLEPSKIDHLAGLVGLPMGVADEALKIDAAAAAARARGDLFFEDVAPGASSTPAKGSKRKKSKEEEEEAKEDEDEDEDEEAEVQKKKKSKRKKGKEEEDVEVAAAEERTKEEEKEEEKNKVQAKEPTQKAGTPKKRIRKKSSAESLL